MQDASAVGAPFSEGLLAGKQYRTRSRSLETSREAPTSYVRAADLVLHHLAEDRGREIPATSGTHFVLHMRDLC